MKTNLSTLKRLFLAVCCVMLSQFASGQTYQMGITNETQVDSKTYEFDWYVLRTGTTSLELTNVQMGLGFDISILNGGTLTASFVANQSQLNPTQVPASINVGAASYLVSGVNYRYINVAAKANPGAGLGTIISNVNNGCSSIGTRIARIRIVNTVDFAAGSSCKHIFSTAVGSGKTNTVISAYVAGNPVAITSAASNFGYTSLGTCTQNILFNVPSCTAATLSSVITNQTCSNVNNGAIDLTATGGSPAPSFAWTKVGGGFNAVSEDISGLAPGDYTVVATSGACSSTATYTVGAGAEATTVPSTVSACGSYTWPQNGQTYTSSGTYTSVSGCTTYELTLNVTPIPVQPTLACYETATFNSTTCSWDVTGTQPAMPTLACYQTASFNTTTCSWDVTGTQPAQPTLACYQTASFNTTTCSWDVTGTQPAQPTLACYETASFNNTTCSWDVTGTQPAQPTLACYETASFNTTTCSWDVTGTQPAQPTLACYQTASFNTTTCSWDVTGTQPAMPTLACYQTASFNTTTCSWDVTGTQPAQPTLACYQTASFNNTTCQWDVTGTQPAQPTLACYETASFNNTTCSWDVTGTQPAMPTLACYQTASFNTTTCSWDVTGTQPAQPTLACYETASFNNTTCSWDVTGTQPAMPTLACYQTASFNNTTCSWDVTGTQPAQPTLACYETASFNTTTCSWDVTGTQPAQPTLACYQTASFNTTTCSWDVTGTQPAMPTLACYQTASFNNTTCQWDVTGTPNPVITTTASACDTYTWAVNGQSYTTSGTYTYSAGCQDYELVLTITGVSSTNTSTLTACDSYTWAANGQTYTASGTYTVVTGCNTEILVLTITPSTSNTTTVSECDSYTWSVNGQTYTASGTYTVVTGCNTEILVLTITPSTSNTTTASNCDSYTWSVNGQTYTASGTYTSVTGCHTEVLVLTITPSTSNTTTASNCDSYTWSVNGQTYTASGTYTSVTGCHTEILVLTITPSTSNTTTASNCDSYTWSVNGQTYTASGTYTSVTGCHTEVLVLTITPSTSNTTTTSACDTYTWSVNGQTYTASGTYTSVTGCATEILVLTITPSVTYYADVDNDGYGDASSPVVSCTGMPVGSVANSGDCNDNNANVNPGMTEVCGNGIDDNCNGSVDEGCGCTNPPTANAGSNASVCVGQNVTLSGSIGGGANNATWTTSGTGTFSPSANVLTATYIPSSADYAAGSVTLTLTTDATAPCTAASSSITASFNALPPSPGAISGPAGLCNPSTASVFTYSVASVAGASSYTWTVPNQVTIVGGQGTTSLQVKFTATGIHDGIVGDICVTANNSNGCGNSAPTCYGISIQITAPVTPPSISGADKACPGDIATYSIANVARATTYTWSVPTGASIMSGQGSNIIVVAYSAGFSGGTMSVVASNVCGSSPARTRTVTQNILAAPAVISGPVDGVCGAVGVVYSVAPISGASSYVWTVPAGASIVGASNGSSITVDFSGAFTTGAITAAAANNCGTGLARSLSVKAVPGTPGVITGPNAVCTNSNQTYSIATVSGATSYTWTIPGGGVINTGQGTKIINMTYGPTASANGIVTVKAVNACGTSAVRILAVVSTVCPRVGESTSLSMVAYPNPVSTELTVEFGSESAQNANITLRDAAGRIVYAESKAAAEGFNSAKVSVDGLASGIYMLQLQMNDRTEQIKVFVTK